MSEELTSGEVVDEPGLLPICPDDQSAVVGGIKMVSDGWHGRTRYSLRTLGNSV